MATNRAKVAARERARRRRLELDAERARRDEQIENAAAEFFQAQESYSAAAARMGSAVATLESLGESAKRVQLLLEIDGAGLRRARQAAGERQVGEQGGRRRSLSTVGVATGVSSTRA